MHAKLLQLCPTLCDPMDCSLPGSSIHRDSPGKNTEVGFHDFLQGIVPTQGSNPCLLHILHWQADSWPLVPPGKPVGTAACSTACMYSSCMYSCFLCSWVHEGSRLIGCQRSSCSEAVDVKHWWHSSLLQSYLACPYKEKQKVLLGVVLPQEMKKGQQMRAYSGRPSTGIKN